MTFWLCIGLLMQVVNKAAEFEQRALEAHASYAITLAILGAVLAAARWRTAGVARSAQGEVQFEEPSPWEVQVLGLNRDGA